MADLDRLEAFLAAAHVDAAVFRLLPDYRAMVLAVDGLLPAPSDQVGEGCYVARRRPDCLG